MVEAVLVFNTVCSQGSNIQFSTVGGYAGYISNTCIIDIDINKNIWMLQQKVVCDFVEKITPDQSKYLVPLTD